MEISIKKSYYIEGKGQIEETKKFPIVEMKKVIENTNMFIAIYSFYHGENESQYCEIHKVQFIALCDVELKNGILVAFHIGEFGTLCSHVIDYDLPTYYCPEKEFSLLDYKSYCEVCDLTGETKKTFPDYLKIIKEGSIVINYLDLP